jgi:hypothetical protein
MLNVCARLAMARFRNIVQILVACNYSDMKRFDQASA